MPGIRVVVAAVAVGLGLSACTSPEQDQAVDAADSFVEAVSDQDATAACRRLAPATRSELEQSAGVACEDALLEEVEPAGTRHRAATYGSMTQVRYAEDVLFLARFDDEWLVMAAGCSKPPAQPYDCSVSGR